MNLRQFLDSLPPRAGIGFAGRCGIAYTYLLSFTKAKDPRTPSAPLTVVIERESNYQVRRWDLRPNDWHLIWPELVGAKGAPDVPTKSVEAEQQVG